MQKFRFDEMTRGWFIGDFLPSALRTKDFEVGLVKHKKGDTWDKHYHEHVTEVSLFLKGKVRVNDEVFSENFHNNKLCISLFFFYCAR